MRIPHCVLAALGSILSVTAGHAATLTATDLLNQFNLITTGDVTGSSGFHADGRVLAGGNYKVEDNSVVYMNGKGAASDFDELVVAGQVTSTVKVNNGGHASVGGGLDRLTMNGGGTKAVFGNGSAPSGYGQVLSDYASTLAAMPGSGSVVREGGANDRTNRFTITSPLDGIGVLSLTEGDLRADRDFVLNLGTGVNWVVVNIRATDADKVFSLGSTFKAQQDSSVISRVLWNFIGFTDVIFDAQFKAGAVLADGSRLRTNAGNIDASVFADSFDGFSELHFGGLAGGKLPGDVEAQQPAPVPVPAGLPLLLSALGIGAVALRRRRSA